MFKFVTNDKITQNIRKDLGGILEWILIFSIIFNFAIRTSPVQTFIAVKVASYLSKELKATVAIKTLDKIFLNKLSLDEFTDNASLIKLKNFRISVLKNRL